MKINLFINRYKMHIILEEKVLEIERARIFGIDYHLLPMDSRWMDKVREGKNLIVANSFDKIEESFLRFVKYQELPVELGEKVWKELKGIILQETEMLIIEKTLPEPTELRKVKI